MQESTATAFLIHDYLGAGKTNAGAAARAISEKDMRGRDKPGHDSGEVVQYDWDAA